MLVQPSEIARARAAVTTLVASLGLAGEKTVVVQNSNKLTLRVLPCDLLARVAPPTEQNAAFELALAEKLAESDAPVAALDPRVEPTAYQQGGFVITLWTYYRSTPSADIPPADYADALHRLHAAMRGIDLPTPHCTDRVAAALDLLADPARTPELNRPDRELLIETLTILGSRVDAAADHQLLHGEPHPGNLLATTADGLRFIDLETCCRGPIEFDLAHAPDEVGGLASDADQDLLRDCRILMLAMISTWRWDHNDQFPDGHRLGREWLAQIRAARSETRHGHQ